MDTTSNNIRIKCPDSALTRADRIREIICSFNQWLSAEEFKELVAAFGGEIDDTLSIEDRIRWLKETFTDVWDYRKKQRKAQTREGEAARWLLQNDGMIREHEALIYRTAHRLGLIDPEDSVFTNPDYLLPLGGARMANLRRCELAALELSKLGSSSTVVALSGMRPISESERIGNIDLYAPDARTEFDAICAGMRIAFPGIISEEEIMTQADDNPNLFSTVKRFQESENSATALYAVAAPSTDHARRANSTDCFRFFFDTFKVPRHSKIINCTSRIFCPYQQVRSLFFAIDYEVEFDTIGFPFVLNSPNPDETAKQLSEAVNYLQEIKATIDAMYDFINTYCSES